MTRTPALWLLALALLLVAQAMARPVDHDESQYVASAVLTAGGLLPYRDYAYLQTPLQPFLFALIAALAGEWAWPALRIANALLGAVAAGFVYAAAREARARPAAALAAAALFVTCDSFLFSVGTARNDALPAALLASALPLVVRGADGRATRASAMLAGLLLAGAAAAKISYALPAAAFGLHALVHQKHRPRWIALGTTPLLILVGWSITLSQDGFWFGVIDFPARGPAQYLRSIGKVWKLGFDTKLLDVLKFLALGPALLAFLLATRFHWRRGERALDWMLAGAVIAALLPTPTWRQYLLPVLPILFTRLAVGWSIRPPRWRARVAAIAFACAGLMPTVAALMAGEPAMPEAMREGRAIGRALRTAGITGPVLTLSPQFLPAARARIDPRFAPGPFYFRSTTLLDPASERRLRLISRARLDSLDLPSGGAVLTGGEADAPGGDARLDARLSAWARGRGARSVTVPGTPLTLTIMPPRASPPPAAGRTP